MNGVLLNTTSNLRRTLRMTSDIKEAFAKSRLSETVKKWVNDFDQVVDLNREYWLSKGWDFNAKINEVLGFEKTQVIDTLVSNLTGSGVDTNVIQGLQQKIKEGIVTKQKYSDLRKTVSDYIVGDEGDGQLAKYAKVITNDSMRGFDGTIQKVVSDEYDFDGFRYVGSLIKDSRKTCVGLINAPAIIYLKKEKKSFPNPYAAYVIEHGIYMQKDLPDIIRISENNGGWNHATTPDTFFVYRGGYNCRHQALPYMLTQRQKDLYESKHGK
jgi:uncharacterized protein YutD